MRRAAAVDGSGGGGAAQGRWRLRCSPPRHRSEGQGQRKLPHKRQFPTSFTQGLRFRHSLVPNPVQWNFDAHATPFH